MKRKLILYIFAIAITSMLIFSGCGKNALYGSWQMKEIIDLKTGEANAPMFANIMVFKINKDGTVDFADKEFGTYTMDRNEFHFVEISDKEEKMDMTGAFRLDGADLYISPDDLEVEYHLVAVVEKDEDKEKDE